MFITQNYYMISTIHSINKWYGDFIRNNKVKKGVMSIINDMKSEDNDLIDNSIYRLPFYNLVSLYYKINSQKLITTKLKELVKNTNEHSIFLNNVAQPYHKYFFLQNLNILQTGGGNNNGKIAFKY